MSYANYANTPDIGKLTSIQFCLTASNSDYGLTGANGQPSWTFNPGLYGVFDMEITGCEFSSVHPADAVLVLSSGQINSAYSGTGTPGYMFSVYTTNQIPWTKRKWYQPDQRFSGYLTFQLTDLVNGPATDQLQNMNYCLLTINFYEKKK